MTPDNETAQEVAKATKAIADASGKLIEASRDAGGFIARFIAGPLEQGVGIFEDKLKYMRWDRQVRLMKRAQEVIAQCGFGDPTRPVPMKVAIPLFQGASLEEDDALQDRWVNLLVNAGYSESGLDVRRAYVEILGQLDGLEAQILDRIYALPFDQVRHEGVLTCWLPERAEVATTENRNSSEPSDRVCGALANLQRLGCVSFGLTWGGGENFRIVNSTRLGRDFVVACRKPSKAEGQTALYV
ncbi:Abi-alpha family protein [Achromobacter sp. ESBL13]|uniref:Abi-alpha family protein n=1 Tax=Achromobacter sp. ESBL13 TaxID=3077328 RepID=UPI002FC776E3